MQTDENLYKTIAGIALITGLLLLIPLVAMQFTHGVDWSPGDFLIAGTLLFSTGLAYKLVTRKSANSFYRAAVGLALLTGLFLVWVSLGVGIIGSGDHPVNQLYFGVIAIGIFGALTVQFRSPGMATVMIAMAIAQVVIVAVALIAEMHLLPASSIGEILLLNLFFVILFVSAALLFRLASREQKPATTEGA